MFALPLCQLQCSIKEITAPMRIFLFIFRIVLLVGLFSLLMFAKNFQDAQLRGQSSLYPNPKLTPGTTLNVTSHDVCVPGYSSGANGVRNVPDSEKNAVYAAYGIKTHQAGEYEVDHFIPLTLGGSNDIRNLWPQPASPKPGFHEKDRVEFWLHIQVCSNGMELSTAQQMVKKWPDTWAKMNGKLGGADLLGYQDNPEGEE